MQARSVVEDFLLGARLSIPVIVASAPFGMLFGVVAIDNGFTVSEAVFMSAAVFAGASQMVGIEMFGQKIAPWLIVFSIFAVNFRHILYSAVVGRKLSHWSAAKKAAGFFFLVDPTFAEMERKSEEGRKSSFAWYMGLSLPLYLCWVVEGAIGATFGRLLPDTHALGFDFMLPIYFLGLVMSFRKRPLWLPVVAASAAASMIAYKTVGSPWHVTIGAAAGILLAAIVAPANGNGAEKL